MAKRKAKKKKKMRVLPVIAVLAGVAGELCTYQTDNLGDSAYAAQILAIVVMINGHDHTATTVAKKQHQTQNKSRKTKALHLLKGKQLASNNNNNKKRGLCPQKITLRAAASTKCHWRRRND